MFSPDEIRDFFSDEILQDIANRTERFTGRLLEKILNSIVVEKSCSDDGVLTCEMIQSVVDRYVEQENPQMSVRASSSFSSLTTNDSPDPSSGLSVLNLPSQCRAG
jgi:hypothetical protein